MQNRGSIVLIAVLGVVGGFSTGMLSFDIGIKLLIVAVIAGLQAAVCISMLRPRRSPAPPVDTRSYPVDPPVDRPPYPVDPPVNTAYRTGVVKWFNPVKGYGFIHPDNGERDVFVHIATVERAGLRTLDEGQRVQYLLVIERGKTMAENLRIV